jgi:hypothetical protein
MLKGYIGRFAPDEDATAVDPSSWHVMFRNALIAAVALPQMIQSDVEDGRTVGQPADG